MPARLTRRRAPAATGGYHDRDETDGACGQKQTPARAQDAGRQDRPADEGFLPASDPPSFSGGKHIIGAPVERESDSPTAETHAVKEAEKKVKTGDAKVPHTY
ncbi:MAG: hypothetical protein WDM86_21375 [Rhizomicrobium sp.]